MTIQTAMTQPEIRAERVTLRPLRRSDLGLIEHYAADPRVARGTRTIPHPLPPGSISQMIDRATREGRSEDIWAIDGSAAGIGEVLGLVSLARLEPIRGRQQSEVGYWVAPAFWNAGFAQEALRALIEANPHADDELFAEVFQDNAVSARVLTNCGFEYLGDAEAYSVARDTTVPTWTYALKLKR
ncbi:GNAT family N-acetyltransferase [Pseudoroseicyclus aestuarii]|uniref:RimJ/RimL family protein N-acetyltransferase n=1 Tax=Pseudoroseicyclus aestuarii TaxID=1795041 RepID=A0A318SXP8_9RHOB|nr:GNAT family N-acetyltransferase [Pseudoroseicyclus aestuarii]PYE86142.1 RimJ/RimL family protein N-acetyltransferase [Pseudoroseicyclus aestuarii]